MLIRRERPDDADRIRQIHTLAFSPAYDTGDPVEPGLVDDLRRSTAWIDQLSLVAERGSAIVGHVCCTRAYLKPDGHAVLGLGPIGVLPEYQRDGVGAALMHAVIAAADARDEPLIVLLGHPEYYPRFGFVPAADLGVIAPVAEWKQAFLARTLAAHDPSLTGEFEYAEPFRNL